MIPLALQEVAAAVGGELVGDARTEIRTVSTDSRTVADGALFVALPGERADGHDHVAAAVTAGAAAVLVSRPMDAGVPEVRVADTWLAVRALAADVRRRVDPATVAVTGSVGKTTVKDLTAAALGSQRRTVAARGSFNNELGVPLTLLELTADTQALVTEIGARHVGDIATLAPVAAPDVAVVTAVAGVHLEIFGSIERVAVAKRELVESLGPSGVAVLNVADPRVAAMATAAPAVISVALDDPRADVHARDVVLDRHARASATAVTPWGRVPLTLPIAGRHHVGNALLALAVAGHLEVDLHAAAAALAGAPVSRWRGEVVEAGDVVVVNDAYNANPTSVGAALDTLVAVERTGRTHAVLGVMAEIGDDHHREHVAVGARCAELGVDELVVVGDLAVGMAEGARAAGLAHVVEVPDADTALEHLLASVAPGDVVLVKASRVGGLERVADGLVEARGERDTAGTPRDARNSEAPLP
ncbi:UDP-N-acetylmuramoyl-tripeptide--D-alanyl-D-alanine ligase [Egicoccus halophilus]|uniref:UDP-N-acetylmuramoyl-tripeptide--D-alanyl-D-alanine ligase n=1 Tax=Egicoccus halophilus TaxID=1670830 RepID=A0A8J3A6A7_9ACTN|nr:UDP-N-acetylmuramoyl-tripeptide--D-alanyl-D-alanine ligase [Egicoccus halophilus]GGI04319.1 UDP-N-acetylmuramoyl-tripeptide--D-alanyl-D-alanine ligase [Egicoccus halophilus]